jgi:hypothetical protein
LVSRGISTTKQRELMILPIVEYDAGESLHLSSTPTFQLIKVHSRRGEVQPSHFELNLKF